MDKQPIFTVEDFGVSFSRTDGGERGELAVIDSLDLELYPGQISAVVGASGSGKSLLAHAILGILPENAVTKGKLTYRGTELTPKAIAELRGTKIALIPQSVSFLDPLMRVGDQLGARFGIAGKKNRMNAAAELLSRYSLAPEVSSYYPHQLSGGMARRVLIAHAMAGSCEIIIADEPTPGLDERTLNEVLDELTAVAKTGAAVLMITHDLAAAQQIAQTIAIFYAGSTLEIMPSEDFGSINRLRHPFSRALYSAMPEHDFIPINGSQPQPGEVEGGCLFAARCPLADIDCKKNTPERRALRGGSVRCIHAS